MKNKIDNIWGEENKYGTETIAGDFYVVRIESYWIRSWHFYFNFKIIFFWGIILWDSTFHKRTVLLYVVSVLLYAKKGT